MHRDIAMRVTAPLRAVWEPSDWPLSGVRGVEPETWLQVTTYVFRHLPASVSPEPASPPGGAVQSRSVFVSLWGRPDDGPEDGRAKAGGRALAEPCPGGVDVAQKGHR